MPNFQRNNNYQSKQSYGNNNNNSGNNYQRSNNQNQGQNQQVKKSSGAKVRTGYTTKQGVFRDVLVFSAWNKSKARGFIKLIAVERKGDKAQTKSDNYTNFSVKVLFADGVKWFNGLYNHETKKLTIPELEMVVNPAAPNGGYFGKYFNPNKR